MAVGHWNDSVIDLIPGYRKTKRSLEKARERSTDKAEKEIIGGMIGDVEYALEWLQQGGNPYRRRGVEARYERPWNPAWIDRYRSPSGWTVERESVSRELTADERFRIEEAMRDLSAREKQCYMMHVVDGWSFGRIGRELHLDKRTVADYVDRAKAKIEEAKLTNLFLL
jgi:positive control factor